MTLLTRKHRFYFLAFLKHDFKASITVFFVALPLCLGVSLASGAPVHTGLIAGVIGGLIIPLISKSSLSVSGPAAGLTAICAAAIADFGNIELFFLSVALAGIFQMLLGLFRLGGFTHFIPSAVIKGMLAAIGIILISKQIPLLIGYDQPDFWREELFNIFTFRHGFDQITDLVGKTSAGAIAIACLSLIFLMVWKKKMARKISILPTSFITVLSGALLAYLLPSLFPELALKPSQFVSIPVNVFSQIALPDFAAVFNDPQIWRTAVIICFVATLETLLSIEAIDKIDPENRITPQNRELIAQGTGNVFAGLMGGIPITSVIVRSSANAEAGGKTKLAAFFHGLWLLLTILFAANLVMYIPYCVLAVILIRTGYNLAKPSMIAAIYKQGREQFLPFLVTVVAILFSDLLIGVLIGIAYAIYYLIKHTYRAGYTLSERQEGHTRHYVVKLALNVSFLNKKKVGELLESIPGYSILEIDGTSSVYIDNDILEIFQSFRAKAKNRHIELITRGIPEVETLELHG
jgi:MFS superfamily sulfate permease-like transporter